MILPRQIPGVAFGAAEDGDPRRDHIIRARLSTELGISTEWVTIDQVHGADVLLATGAAHLGDADGIISSTAGLPVAIATADCVPVVLRGEFTIAVLHAGWRGISAGIVEAGARGIADAGDAVRCAVIGPHIGPCCYEVTPNIVEAVGGHAGSTKTGRLSADLAASVRSRLPEIEVFAVGSCTMHGRGFHSHRRDGATERQVTVAWIPPG